MTNDASAEVGTSGLPRMHPAASLRSRRFSRSLLSPAWKGGGDLNIPPTCFLKTSNSEYTNVLHD